MYCYQDKVFDPSRLIKIARSFGSPKDLPEHKIQNSAGVRNVQTVYKWLRNENLPSTSHLNNMSKYFKVSMEVFYRNKTKEEIDLDEKANNLIINKVITQNDLARFNKNALDGMLQKSVANKLLVPESTVRGWRLGLYKINLFCLAKLVAAYGNGRGGKEFFLHQR